MYTAVFELTSWMGKEYYFFIGESAVSLLAQLNEVQSLECLAQMGEVQETTADGKSHIAKLSNILEKYHNRTLQIDDLLGFNINLSIGSIKCCEVKEGNHNLEELQTKYKK